MRLSASLPFFLLAVICGCSSKVEPTEIEVKDPDRHYYPIVNSYKLKLAYSITNKGEEPLIIDEIVPSCGCIIIDRGKRVVPPGRDITIRMVYDSSKNLGYAHHNIYLYGNIKPHGFQVLSFDVNVVPPNAPVLDYELLYEEQKLENAIEEAVNGEYDGQNYYVGREE